jgi:hypothetical protein
MIKPTYKELENEFKKEHLVLGFSFMLVSILAILFFALWIGSVIGDLKENEQLKEQLNSTNEEVPVEVDYHSSGELFCEHYNGTYNGGLDKCNFIIDDINSYCYIMNINGKYAFMETCEVLK